MLVYKYYLSYLRFCCFRRLHAVYTPKVPYLGALAESAVLLAEELHLMLCLGWAQAMFGTYKSLREEKLWACDVGCGEEEGRRGIFQR